MSSPSLSTSALEPKAFSIKMKALAETIGQYSPLIVIFGVWVITLFNNSVLKGLTYITFMIFALLLRLGGMKCVDTEAPVASVAGTSPTTPTKGPRCSMGTDITGDNETLGMYIISFTMWYVCFPMFLINDINWGLFVFFIFALVFNILINKSCIATCKGAAAINVIISGLVGIFFSAGVYSYANALSIIRKDSSNAQTCGVPSKQTFRCKVKTPDGETIAETDV
jgi:hypothetical protein